MKLFICYSRQDEIRWALEFWRALRDEAHHDAWIDQQLVPAQDWWKTILDEIEACECFIYVMTPKSVESMYCLAELEYALAINKPVLPLKLKDCNEPASVERFHYQTIGDHMSIDKVLVKVLLGLAQIQSRIASSKHELVNAPRPAPPKPDSNKPEHVYEAFALAEEALVEHNLTFAEEHYKQVIKADRDGLGKSAQQRLEAIALLRDCATRYTVIKRLLANPMTLEGARAAWQNFVEKCPDYDPENLANDARLQTKMSPTPRNLSDAPIKSVPARNYDLLDDATPQTETSPPIDQSSVPERKTDRQWPPQRQEKIELLQKINYNVGVFDANTFSTLRRRKQVLQNTWASVQDWDRDRDLLLILAGYCGLDAEGEKTVQDFIHEYLHDLHHVPADDEEMRTHFVAMLAIAAMYAGKSSFWEAYYQPFFDAIARFQPPESNRILLYDQFTTICAVVGFADYEWFAFYRSDEDSFLSRIPDLAARLREQPYYEWIDDWKEAHKQLDKDVRQYYRDNLRGLFAFSTAQLITNNNFM